MPKAKTRLETLQTATLLQCVFNEDRVQIQKLIASGVPNIINFKEPTNGETALTTAAVANNEDMVKFLLEVGASPDVVDGKGRSPAMRAAEYGHVQTLEILADAGANMKLRDFTGKGILFYCFSLTRRHKKCAEIALKHGADVNNMSIEGVPVFLEASKTSKENEDICLLLLESGADPTIKDKKSEYTSLMAASLSGSAAVVATILDRGAEPNDAMLRSYTHAAHEAAKGGHLDVLRALSAYGAKFDQVDEHGNTPIHYAAKAGHALCCRFLAQRGCNPKPKNSDGQTARVIAKSAGHKDAIRECRRAEGYFGKTAKNNERWALALYDFTCVKRQQLEEMFQKLDVDGTGKLSRDDFTDGLANAGAPLPDDNIDSLLRVHDKEHMISYAEFLSGKKYVNKAYLMSAYEGKKKKGKRGKGGRKRGGKTKIPVPICTRSDDARNETGGPPVIFVPKDVHFTDVARFSRDERPTHPIEDDCGWYLDAPGESFVELHHAIKNKDMNTLKAALVNSELDVDLRDKYFKTPLMTACLMGDLELVQFLIECGANVQLKDNLMWTPLHFACHSGMRDIAEYLLDRGAVVDAPTLNGATPLMRAIQSCKLDVVQLMLDRGAKLRVENRKGEGPMEIAAAYGNYEVYTLIDTKWKALPPLKEKKGGKRKPPPKAPAKPRPKTATSGDAMIAQQPTDESTRHVDSASNRRAKGSILRAASALASGIDDTEDITYRTRNTWKNQPTTDRLIAQHALRRDRYGWESDFDDFHMPFLKNVYNKAAQMGGV